MKIVKIKKSGQYRIYVERICKDCGKKSLVRKDLYRDRCRTCYYKSKEGKPTWNKGKKMSKAFCEKISKIKKDFLSNPENHWNWQGGKTSLYAALRNSELSFKWKQDVKKRDNFTCQRCGDSTSNNLESHHIKPFSQILKEFLSFYNQFSPIEDREILLRLSISWPDFWKLENGKTLCKECHKKTESYSVKNS